MTEDKRPTLLEFINKMLSDKKFKKMKCEDFILLAVDSKSRYTQILSGEGGKLAGLVLGLVNDLCKVDPIFLAVVHGIIIEHMNVANFSKTESNLH